MKHFGLFPLVVAMLLGAVSPAVAQSCGATLSQSVALTRDLHCPGHAWALRIDTPGVVLDLRGHTISGATTGVVVDSADDVAIVGPGRLTGFICRVAFTFAGAGVSAIDADRLVVSDVTFSDFGRAVALEGVSGARIHDNTITATDVGFQVLDAPARRRGALDNEIAGNVMIGTPNCGSIGAMIEGNDARGNLLYANRFENIYQGVLIAAPSNSIISNLHVGLGLAPNQGSIPGAGVQIAAGSGNSVVGNVVRNASIGVYISPFHYPYTGTPFLDSFENQVIANRLSTSHFGVLVGDGGAHSTGIVYKNRIGDNDIRGARIGLQFNADAADNNGIGNGYRGVGVPVMDYGQGNQWP